MAFAYMTSRLNMQHTLVMQEITSDDQKPSVIIIYLKLKIQSKNWKTCKMIINKEDVGVRYILQ